jgi:hypothetical protein
MSPRRTLLASLALCALLLAGALAPAGAQADFGIKSLSVEPLQAGGALPDLRAGSHPYEFKFKVAMNTDSEGHPEGTLRQLLVDFPAGLLGNPQALPRCPAADFEGFVASCPGETQIGVVHLEIRGFPNGATGPVYNLTPPSGVAASFGFSAANKNSFQEASVRTGSDYGVTISDITVPTDLEIQSIEETIWGVPAASGHDEERTCLPLPGETLFRHGCSSELTPAPFLSLPTACAGPLRTTVTVSSVQEPSASQSASAETLGEEGQPQGLHACDPLPFEPTIEARPETTAADSPTGLHVDLHVPQGKDPEGLATAHLKNTTVTLPQGLELNPSSADGLGACTPAQIDLHGPGPAGCPASSRLGTVEVRTPVFDHPLPGAVYLASQGENPFGSLLALYIAVDDPITGVVVKLAAKVEPDPVTGQLRTTVTESPQVPFEDFELDFTGGPRAALTTPPTCGTYTTSTEMVPWSAPEGPSAHPSDSFAITSASGGGPCAPGESQLPNAPAFEAGTATPLAGAYSPFVLKLSREDGSQRLSALNVTLPPGLTGKLAGTAECSDAQIAAAAARSNPGEGALEKASPSCPAASELGTVNVGAGSGAPFYVQGHAYLAGPYKGAPLSMAIITPAVAGPFDLGVVVVRSALYVNETTAQITVKSDPIPTMLQGIPLEVRSVAVKVDRDQFTLNPTSCEAKAVGGEAVSTTGAVAQLSNRFQVGGCKGLGFAPKLAISLKGATKRAGHPALKAVVTYPKGAGYANIASAQVGLPHAEFLDQGNLDKVCTQPELHSQSCPKSSVYGHAKAWTPLLDAPLEGPVYLGVGFGHKLPDLVADLNGQIRILLNGRVDTTKQDGLRNTFEAVPDAPVSKFVLEMKGGSKYGLLENSENVCGKTQRATAKLLAQNGQSVQLHPKIVNSCGNSSRHRRGA